MKTVSKSFKGFHKYFKGINEDQRVFQGSFSGFHGHLNLPPTDSILQTPSGILHLAESILHLTYLISQIFLVKMLDPPELAFTAGN